MLFDLRSGGRRRSVKVIYTGLAVLIGVGLVGFGVGSVGGGSIGEIIGKEGHGGNGYAAKIAAAQKRIKQNPKEAAGWAALTEAQLHEAALGSENYDTETERYTAQGKEKLRQAATSWDHYLRLTSKPSITLAKEMSNIYGFEGLDEPAGAIQTLRIMIAANPHSAHLYSQLADYSYLERSYAQGDRAAKKAVSLVPKIKRALMESEFERLKSEVKKAYAKAPAGASGTGAGASAGSSAAGAGGTTATSTTSSSRSLATSTKATSSKKK